jgi:hypothetical protein
MNEMTQPAARQCFYIPAEQFDENGYIPSLVTEGQAGHAPLTGNGPHASPWYWGKTYEEARAVCAAENAKLGISPEDAARIVLSSVTAKDLEQTEDPGGSETKCNLSSRTGKRASTNSP